MKKRRILSVLLCLALVVFSLSGCNKTSSKKSTSSKKADSGTLQGMIKSVDVDKKQITIATMPSGNQPPSNRMETAMRKCHNRRKLFIS